MNTNGNEPAYPVLQTSYPARDGDYTGHESSVGLTKREAFAMAAMQGILANPSATVSPGNAHILACELADNLLRQLDKDPTK